MASKPVMEGKAVLFKRFADIDSFDIEVEEEDAEKFIECVARFGNTFGGINLEDIGAPEWAIIATAGLINAAHVTGRKFEDMKVVLSGAGERSAKPWLAQMCFWDCLRQVSLAKRWLNLWEKIPLFLQWPTLIQRLHLKKLRKRGVMRLSRQDGLITLTK